MARIAIVSSNSCQGGASRAAFRLHKGLRSIGQESTLLARWNPIDDPTVIGIEDEKPIWRQMLTSAKSFLQRLPTRRYKLGKNCEAFSLCRGPCLQLSELCKQKDIVNLHFVRGMVDVPHFFKHIPGDIPIVITLHDMNWFTGGCHYDGECGKYVRECGACPELNSTRMNDLANHNFNQKLNVFDSVATKQITIVSPSRWLAECAKKSRLLGRFRVETIPYGIDTNEFFPRDSIEIRRTYEIDDDEVVILFVASELTNYRKGIDLLEDAINRLPLTDSKVVLLTMGSTSGNLKRSNIARQINLGHVSSSEQISKAYSVANVYVITSRQDNLPNTVLESLACGTPVVGFDVGGIPDMIQQGKNGFVVPNFDVSSMAKAIEEITSAPDPTQFSRYARQSVEDNFTLHQQAEQYANLFTDLLM